MATCTLRIACPALGITAQAVSSRVSVSASHKISRRPKSSLAVNRQCLRSFFECTPVTNFAGDAKPFEGNASRLRSSSRFSRASRHTALKVDAIFTGIVEEMGSVQELKDINGGVQLTVVCTPELLADVKLGDSIAVNGTCLTVTTFGRDYFTVGLAPETLRKTSLGEVVAGSKVNLERSLQPSSRMGGHFVQGHVDGTGIIKQFKPEGDSVWVTIGCSPSLMKYIVPKGYIAVDGTSLTVVDTYPDGFTFMLVAYTQVNVVIPLKKVGDKVNLEVDIVGKYVEKMMAGYQAKMQAGA
eukprot:jgi/Mesvir1/444/Mv11322-RA.1